MKIRNLQLLFLIIIFGCQDEFLLETINYEPIMVIDGLITNEVGPYKVKLTLNCPIDDLADTPIERCIVTITDNVGNSEVLREEESGIYTTSEEGIHGIVGNSYKLSIITEDGRKYVTDYSEMKASIEIDSVYKKVVAQDECVSIYDFPGYQFYIATKTAESKENYFLWTMTETYQYTANYLVTEVLYTDSTLEAYKARYRCWKTEKAKYFFTGKTENLVVPKISEQPLHFVGTNTRKLQEKYSLQVNQYILDKESYDFWRNVEEQISSKNFVFLSQPFDIVGNVKNSEDPNEVVYGNFTVASVTKHRIYVDPPHVPTYFDDGCSVNYNIDDLRYGIPAFLVNAQYGVGAVDESCIDCTSKGGELIKPDFWIY